MSLNRLALLALPIAFAVTAATASAQTATDDWSRCRGDEPADAIAGCTKLLQAGQLSESEHSEALSARAGAYREQRDYPHAIADYEEALRLNPRAVWAHAGLALSHRGAGHAQQAVGEFDIALGLAENQLGNAGPQSAEYARRASRIGLILLERGLAYENLHDDQHAIADYREGMRRAPHEPEIGNALCWILAVRGESLDEARSACDQSLRDRPNDAPTLDSRGLVGLKQHRFQDAWNDYDAATRLGEGPSWVFGRGVAALRLGRTAEGQADIARAEAMNAGVRQFYADFGIRP
jgi:tetratricopeptide (TPR) repeat protein